MPLRLRGQTVKVFSVNHQLLFCFSLLLRTDIRKVALHMHCNIVSFFTHSRAFGTIRAKVAQLITKEK